MIDKDKTSKMPYPKITDIKFSGKPRPDKNFISYVSILLDDNLLLRSIRIVKNREGKLIISMPAYKDMNDRYCDYYFPVNNEYRKWIEHFIIKEYMSFIETGKK
jgi:DNA-binding cell septation regulator SpoVG